VETAKAAGLEPRAYLHYLFETLPTVPTPDGIQALLPDRLTPDDLKIPYPACKTRTLGYPDAYRLEAPRHAKRFSSMLYSRRSAEPAHGRNYSPVSSRLGWVLCKVRRNLRSRPARADLCRPVSGPSFRPTRLCHLRIRHAFLNIFQIQAVIALLIKESGKHC